MHNGNEQIVPDETPEQKKHKKHHHKKVKVSLDVTTKIGIAVIMICLIIIGMQWWANDSLQKRFEALDTERALPAITNVWQATFDMTMYTNHYTECSKKKGHKYFGITYSGRKALPYKTVAVDPNVIPLGSVLINEMGHVFIAEDTGNAVIGYIVDLYIGEGTPENRAIADRWGKKKMWFVVIEHKGGKVDKNTKYMK